MVRKAGMSIVFFTMLLTMWLPFYGFRGVSEIPGIAAITEYNILLPLGEMSIFSNIPVLIFAILLYYFCLWGGSDIWQTNRIRIAFQVLSVILIEIGKWEYLLEVEHSIRLSLWGFWLNSALNLILILLCFSLKSKIKREC